MAAVVSSGLGSKKSGADDNWLVQQDDFDSLLSELADAHGGGGDTGGVDGGGAGAETGPPAPLQSLEEKSRHSRSRVQ